MCLFFCDKEVQLCLTALITWLCSRGLLFWRNSAKSSRLSLLWSSMRPPPLPPDYLGSAPDTNRWINRRKGAHDTGTTNPTVLIPRHRLLPAAGLAFKDASFVLSLGCFHNYDWAYCFKGTGEENFEKRFWLSWNSPNGKEREDFVAFICKEKKL